MRAKLAEQCTPCLAAANQPIATAHEPAHEHLCHPQLMRSMLPLGWTWFQGEGLGRTGKFSRNISNPQDKRLHQLFCSQNYFFLFLLFTGFLRFDERPS